MRNVNCNVLSASDHLSTNGHTIDSNQLVSASFHVYFGDATAAGTFKLQASNDPFNDRPMFPPSGFEPTNWVDVPNQTASITAGASALLTIANCAYRWLRAVYLDTAAGVQTVTCVADTAGSLNNKYFLISAGNSGINYYVWMNVNSAGTDPMIAGKTGVEVALSTGATASQVATAVAAALDALTTFASTAVSTVATVTNSQTGPFTAASDSTGLTATAFTFAVTGGGTTTVNVNMDALSI